MFPLLGIVLVFLSACSVPPQTTASTKDNPGESSPLPADNKDFSALINAEGQVVLTWKAKSGVEGYLVELQIGGDEYIPLANLPADQTTFTDGNAPSDSSLTYRLTGMTKSKSGETALSTVVTPMKKIAPLKITVEFDKIPAAIDPNNLDISTMDLSKLDPENLDLSMFMPKSTKTEADIGPRRWRTQGDRDQCC